MNLALRYAFFAVLATATNLLAQEMSLLVYSETGALVLAVLAGTAVGLLVKYQLDKKYIFQFVPANRVQDTVAFARYTVMGVATTFVFWGFEFGFDWLFQTKTMRYVGAVLGLGIGYFLKYKMDKRFVFVERKA